MILRPRVLWPTLGSLLALGLLVWRWEAAPAREEVPAPAAPPPSARVSLPDVDSTPTPPVGAPEVGSPTAEAPPEELLVRVVTDGTIRDGQTLVGSLASRGVDGVVAHVLSTEMAPVFNFRYARPGDRYELVQDEQGQVVSFRYVRSAEEYYTIQRDGEDGYVAQRHTPELVRRRARAAGVVSTSLYEAIDGLGEDAELSNDFASIFAWDVDFSRSVQPGDEFALLYERLHAREGGGDLTYVRPGRILAARYSNDAADYTAIYFEREEGRGGYYRPDGSSVRRQFLKAPLHYRRISSRYSLSRLHPILKVRRPHQGIDYAAPFGTPVWAVGDGTVIFVGWNGGFGKLVKVRHANGYISHYGHLSRYASGVRVGQRVQQKQVIGYVGSTGLSTGPHLDFRISQRGRYVNPASLQLPVGEPISESLLPSFAAVRDDALRELDPVPLTVLTSEAL